MKLRQAYALWEYIVDYSSLLIQGLIIYTWMDIYDIINNINCSLGILLRELR